MWQMYIHRFHHTWNQTVQSAEMNSYICQGLHVSLVHNFYDVTSSITLVCIQLVTLLTKDYRCMAITSSQENADTNCSFNQNHTIKVQVLEGKIFLTLKACWRFKSSGMWRVVAWVVPGIPKDCNNLSSGLWLGLDH
jgi:hypothetical protein